MSCSHSQPPAWSDSSPPPRRRKYQLGALFGLLALPLVAHASVDVVVNVTDNPDPIVAGGNLTYTITLDNNGSTGATNVAFDTNDLSADGTLVSVSPSVGSCNSSWPVSCSIGSMAAGENISVALVMQPQTVGTINLSVTSTSTEADTDSTNNTNISQATTVTAGADLATTLTASASPIVAGETVDYLLTVTNNGPSNATGSITVTGTLPPGVTYVSNDGASGWSCSHNAGVVTAVYTGTLTPAQATSTLHITVRPDAVGGSTVTYAMSAQPSTGTPDPDQNNNTDVVDVAVDPGSDVSIDKTPNSASPLQGTDQTFTLTARYNGGDQPTNIIVTDTLTPDWSYVSHSAGSGWSCDFGVTTPNTLTCSRPGPESTVGNLPAITLTATAVNANPSASNTATVTADGSDPNPSNNSDTSSFNIQVPTADLRLTKSANPVAVSEGQNVTYTLAVRNLGPAAQTGTVRITDTLPLGFTLVSASGSGWSCTDDASNPLTVTCDRSGLAANTTSTVTLVATVPAGASGSMVNNATVSCNGVCLTDPNNTNDSSSAAISTTLSGDSADLAIVKTVVGPDPVQAGDVLTYLLTVNNSGPADATNVIVTDSLSNYTGTPTATPSQGSCSFSSSTFTCNLGTVLNGGSATVQIAVRPTSSGSRSNTGSVYSQDIGDPNTGDNSSSTSSTVNPDADLQVTVASSGTLVAGTPLTYVFTVRNNGPSPATTVELLTDLLPPNVDFVSVTASSGGTCNHPVNPICSWSSIGNGVTRTVTLVVRPRLPGDLTFGGSVSSAVDDRNSANDSASVTDTLTDPELDLLINVSDSPDPVPTGGSVTYTVRGTNNGPSTATAAFITDTPPVGLTVTMVNQGTIYDSGNTPLRTFDCTCSGGSDWSLCDNSTPVDCPLGDLNTGDYAEFTVVMTTPVAGVYTNNAAISSVETIAGYEANTANNVTNENTTFKVPADLAVTKLVSNSTPVHGANVTFTITVQNQGPGDAGSVIITDLLPDGYSFVSSNPSVGTYNSGSGVWDIGVLDNGHSATLQIVATVLSSGSYTNTATVTGSSVPDPDPGNNSDSATTTPTSQAPPTVAKAFNPTTIVPGDSSTLTVTLGNSNPIDITLSALFTDTLPAGITVTNPAVVGGSCPGAVTAVAGAGSVSYANGATIPAGGCTITVDVTGNTTGDYVNSIPIGGLQTSAGQNAAPAEATLSIVSTPTVVKAFSPTEIPVDGSSTLTITFGNGNPGDITLTADLVDNLPAGTLVANPANLGGSCAGAVSAVAGGSSVTYPSGATIPNGGCTITLSVTSSTAGSYLNSIAAGALQTSAGNNVSGTEATLLVLAPPSVGKGFNPSTVRIGIGTELTLSLGNTNAGDATLTAPFTDSLPASLTVADPNNLSGSCDLGSVTAVPGSSEIVYASGATIPAGGCTIVVTVVGSSNGDFTNSIAAGALVTDVGVSVDPAEATLTVDPLLLAPQGTKTVSVQWPILTWRIVWINNQNAESLRVRMWDPIPDGTQYVAGSVTCEATGASTVTACNFESGENRVVYEGVVASDSGAADEDAANNEVVITLKTILNPGVTEASNVAELHWDANQDGDIESDAVDGQVAVTASALFNASLMGIPLMPPLLFVAMAAGLLGWGLRRIDKE